MSYKHLGKNYFNYYSVPIKDDVYRDRKNNSTDDDKKNMLYVIDLWLYCYVSLSQK